MDVYWLLLSSNKEINRLLKEINRLISKGLSNIYLNVTIEKKWCTQNVNFLSLKCSSAGQFLGVPAHPDINEFQTYCCNLKIKGLGAKLSLVFLWFLFWKELWRFKVKESMLFVRTLIKTRRNQKWKIPLVVSEGWALCFSSYKNCKSK